MTELADSMPQKVLEEIDARTISDGLRDTREDIVARDLERYYAALAVSYRRLDGLLDVQERWLLLDTCNGTIFRQGYAPWALPDSVNDAIHYNRMDEHFEVEGTVLLVKLKSLAEHDLTALVDAIERAWLAADADPSVGLAPQRMFEVRNAEVLIPLIHVRP